MKKIALLLVSLLAINILSAQETSDDFRLVVSSEGATKEEATHQALLSAIEQAFGTFVSVNTTIINNETVEEEITTAEFGNIKEYEVLNVTQLKNSMYYVTLKATVSIGNLVNYAKSKGSSCELAGDMNTFAYKVKLYKASKKAAEKTLDNLINQLYEMGPYLFDYEVKVGDPTVSNPDAPEGSPISGRIPADVYMYRTKTFQDFIVLLANTMSGISYGKDMYQYYLNMGIKSNQITVYDKFSDVYFDHDGYIGGGYTLIDLDKLMIALDDIFSKAFSNFVIEHNIGKFNCKEFDKKNKIYELDMQDVWCFMYDTIGKVHWYAEHNGPKKINNPSYSDSYDDYIMAKRRYRSDNDYCFNLMDMFFCKCRGWGEVPDEFDGKLYNINLFYNCIFYRDFSLYISDFNKFTGVTIKPLSQKFERDYIKRINNYKLNSKK
ncbi:MAG: hypothetical protein IKJ67_09065 [Bacteroidales bacterium]|nr:hypothetical protein [Bacteroidales bacterium]